MSFKFGDVQLLDIMNFLRGATTLDSFLKAYRTSETKGFFPFEWFDCPQKMNNCELPFTTHFSVNFETWIPLKRTIQIIKKYLAADWRLWKHNLKWGFPNHRLQEKKTTNICLIYGKMKVCVPLKTFYAVTTTKTVYQHSKQCKTCLRYIIRKELTCWSSGVHFRIWRIFVSANLPAPNSIHLLKPTKDLLQMIREGMVGDPFIVFTRKAVGDETFIRNSRNICKSIVVIDASQLYPYSMCQPTPTGLYTRWDMEYDTESNRFKPQQNKSRKFENMVMS